MLEALWANCDGLADELATLYRDFHQHPELSLQEFRTAAKIADVLRRSGFEVDTEIGGTGVVGVLRNGEGPVVMLRADIDALPVWEQTGLPYASTVRAVDATGRDVPVMHACGHDMHAVCLLGAATLLARARGEWSGTVLLVFQPAEELVRGARDMVRDGLFERFPRPEIILAQHVGPLPAGVIGHRGGPVMSGADSLQVTLFGRGGHGARPDTTIDPVLMAAHIVTRLQAIVAREVPPGETAVVTVGRLQAGTVDNIIPDTAELGINLRANTERTRALVRAAVERIIRAEALAAGAEREPALEWSASTPILVSDEVATARTVAAFTEHFGADRIVPVPPVTASEDVGILGEAAAAPTVYWFWGGMDLAGRGLSPDRAPTNHSAEFALDIEPTLTTGVEALVVAGLTWLAKPNL
ncbi:amidohydrolase [Nocardia sp. NPDC046763]|uniref:amidohydrolase n=1 Tax=Nocardia sp. NPDC046763 TaxID=3155256 RepID=UPI0033C1CE0E